MTLTAATPPAVPPAPPSATLNRCGSCAAWWGEAGAVIGTCTAHHEQQRRDAVACPEWQCFSISFVLGSVR